MITFFLKLIEKFAPFWKKIGVHLPHLLAILKIKLLMDDRKPSFFKRHGKSTKESSNQNLILVAFMTFLGLFLMTLLFIGDNLLIKYFFYFSIWMLMLLFFLVSDFMEILFDIRDNFILFPRPVSDKTLAVSRILHILIYLVRIIIPLSLPATILTFFKFGILVGLVFIFQCFLGLTLVVVLVNFLYLFLIKFTKPNTLKNILNYLQIAAVLAYFAGIQFLSDFIKSINLSEEMVVENFIFYLLPSTWIASLGKVLTEGFTSTPILILAGLGLFTPLLCIWIIARFLSKNFTGKILELKQSSDNVPKGSKQTFAQSLFAKLSKTITNNSVEKAGFDLTWKMTARSRTFKRKVYPSIGMMFVLLLPMFLRIDGSNNLETEGLQSINFLLIYMPILLIIIAITTIEYAENFKAAWVFHATPIGKPGQIIQGVLKALFFKFFLPFFLIFLVFSLYYWGAIVLKDFVIGFMIMLFIIAFSGFIKLKEMPFSKSYDEQNKGENGIIATGFLMMISIFGVGHFLLKFIPILLIIFAIGALVLAIYLYRRIGKRSWEDLNA